MTTKAKSTKSTKPAINATAIGKHIGQQLGELQAGYEKAAKATDAINADVKTLRAEKIKIGASRKTCAVAGAIYDAMPTTLSAGTRANMLSSIRKAVNEGGKFSHNPGRKAGASKKTGAKQSSGVIMISFPAGIDRAKAVETIRKMADKFKASENEALVDLAAYLVDAMDDASGE